MLERGLQLEKIVKDLSDTNAHLGDLLTAERESRAQLDDHLANMMQVIAKHIPEVFTCPITQQIIEDAVSLNGSFYTRAPLVKWLNSNYSDPLTNEATSVLSMGSGHVATSVLYHLRSVATDIEAIKQFYVTGARSASEADTRKKQASLWYTVLP